MKNKTNNTVATCLLTFRWKGKLKQRNDMKCWLKKTKRNKKTEEVPVIWDCNCFTWDITKLIVNEKVILLGRLTENHSGIKNCHCYVLTKSDYKGSQLKNYKTNNHSDVKNCDCCFLWTRLQVIGRNFR